jgi:hypothetical protein
MATYKVLQDIEAEDKLLGPFTLKQLLFALITGAIGFIMFKLLTASGPTVVRLPFVLVLFIPFVIFGFLAAPISRDQPNDVWLLARVRFLVKPHSRIWNQDGISQLVSVTAPKKVLQNLTNGLDQSEVQSRLSALASTLDSRGWAIKNVDVNLFAQPGYLAIDDGSDRLVAPSSLPVSQATVDIGAADDIMDTRNNPTAQHLDQIMKASTEAHHAQVVASVQNPAAIPTKPSADYWFLNQPSDPMQPPAGMATFRQSTIVTPGSDDTSTVQPTAEEQALIEKIAKSKASTTSAGSHLKTLTPLSRQNNHQPATNVVPTQTPAPIISQTTTPNPAILNLANNNDLNVATIARQAQHISEADGEVTISLH